MRHLDFLKLVELHLMISMCLARLPSHAYSAVGHSSRHVPVASGGEQHPPLGCASSICAAAWPFARLFPLPYQEESVFVVIRWQHNTLGFIFLLFLLEVRHLTWRRKGSAETSSLYSSI